VARRVGGRSDDESKTEFVAGLRAAAGSGRLRVHGRGYLPIPYIALRAGYAGSHTESSGVRAGIGLKIKDLSFDYAFSPYGIWASAIRYELTMRFGTIRPLLTPEMRRMLRQAKVAMAEGRFGEATMLLDSLIRMEPRYKPFHRLIKTAMGGYEKQEDMAKNQKGLDLSLLHGKKSVKEDNYEVQDLEMLLRMNDEPTTANAKGNLQPATSRGVTSNETSLFNDRFADGGARRRRCLEPGRHRPGRRFHYGLCMAHRYHEQRSRSAQHARPIQLPFEG